MVERRIVVPNVVGSNPITHPTLILVLAHGSKSLAHALDDAAAPLSALFTTVVLR